MISSLSEYDTINMNIRESEVKSVDNIKASIEKVKNNTELFYRAKDDVSELIDNINKLDKEYVRKMADKFYPENKYKDSKGDHSITDKRRELLINLSNGQAINITEIDEVIDKMKKNGAHNWNTFRFTAGLYYNLFDFDKDEEELSNVLGDIFRKAANSKDFKERKIHSLKGANFYGSDFFEQCFLKEKFKPNLLNQIVLRIDEEGIRIHYLSNGKDKQEYNVSYIDINSPTLEQDIIDGYEYAIKYDEEMGEVLPNDISYFSVRCGRKNEYYNEFLDNKFISITWSDIKSFEGMSKLEVEEYVSAKYRKSDLMAMKPFLYGMNIGDIVLILKKGSNKVNICVITSDMKFDENKEDIYRNYRNIEVLKEDVELDFIQNIQRTFVRLRNKENIDLINQAIDEDTIEKYNKILENIGTITTDEDEISDINSFIKNYEQLIIDGPPGTGKSHYVKNDLVTDEDDCDRVTFYQDYEYHNFVGSIIPQVKDGNVSYEYRPGILATVLNKALQNPNKRHFLVIEELTRGNASAIFGDIFQLLDREEDGWSKYKINNVDIYNSLDKNAQAVLNEVTKSVDCIVLPPNMSIVCTINSSDQNVFPLDTAFKRRFNYKIMSTTKENVEDFEISIGGKEISWKSFYTKLNEYLLGKMGLKEDKQIGPYFINNSSDADMESIQTKLAMYLWSDLHKVHTISNKKIFKDSVLTLAQVNEVFTGEDESKLSSILTDDFKEFMNLSDINE